MEQVDCLVIGAGVVGLACARALAIAGREVIIVERASGIGTETSARNSEVIHAGIYYPSGSLKAELCVAGKHALYHYCEERAINHRRCGKLIVASTEAQLADLKALQQKAHANGVTDIELISAAEAMAREPEVHGHAALWSPSTGIVDSHTFMLNLLGDIENHAGMLVLESPVESAKAVDHGIEITTGGESAMTLRANLVINAAGLWAQEIADSVDGLGKTTIPERHLARGVYFSLQGVAPFSRLVYPMPEKGGLGCHFTLDLDGKGRFGPDVEWVDEIDYSVDASRGETFYDSIRQYWPNIPDGALLPDYAGIRPKVAPPGQTGDFIIQGAGDHGVSGLVNLYGIESPGLTASLAIATRVKETVVS